MDLVIPLHDDGGSHERFALGVDDVTCHLVGCLILCRLCRGAASGGSGRNTDGSQQYCEDSGQEPGLIEWDHI